MTVTLDDGTKLDCEFEIIDHGSPGNGWDDPGEASAVELIEATDDDGALWLLTDDQREAVELQLAEMIDADQYFFDVED